MKKLTLLILSLFPIISNAQNSNPSIDGVNYAGFKAHGSQSCTFVSNSAYSCSEASIIGSIISTSIISFNSKEELCSQLGNQNLNSVIMTGLNYSVAKTVRHQYLIDSCSPSDGIDLPVQINPLLKTMSCRLIVEGLDGAKGDSGSMQIPISANGMAGQVYTTMIKEKMTEQLTMTTKKMSSQYVRIQYRFSKDSTAAETDQLSVTATVTNGATVSIKGEARSGVALNITKNGDVEKAEIKCAVTDATSVQKETLDDSYSCNVSGSNNVGNYGTAAPLTSLLADKVTLTKPESKIDVAVNADIPAVAIFNAQLTPSGLSTITAKVNLNKPAEFRVTNLSQGVNIKCK